MHALLAVKFVSKGYAHKRLESRSFCIGNEIVPEEGGCAANSSSNELFYAVHLNCQVMTRSALVGLGKQDIAGKATMTITLNWNVTIAEKIDSFIMKRSKRIIVWTSTACNFELLCYIVCNTVYCTLHILFI